MKKIVILWLVQVGLLALALVAWPHWETDFSGMVQISLGFLLFLEALALVKNEQRLHNKPIFINFAVLFAFYPVQALLQLVFLVPSFRNSVGGPFASFFAFEYVNSSAFYLILALSVVYVAIDALLRDFMIWQKYAMALVLVGIFFVTYYHLLFADPLYLYHTQDMADWKALNVASAEYSANHKETITPAVLADFVAKSTSIEQEGLSRLPSSLRLRRIVELFPYLEGDNYKVLLLRPLYRNEIYMCVLCLGFIILFFGYQYMKDPPQGAYIERIMFMFLTLCTVEIFHAWSFVKSVEWGSVNQLLDVGRYVSVGVLAGMAFIFFRRLHFITSVPGEFYEQELAVSPSGVVRWRDTLDNYVIKHFINPRLLPRRVLAVPQDDRKAQQVREL